MNLIYAIVVAAKRVSLVDVFLQAPSGTLLSQDEIDQILQIWTSMQRQIVSPTTMIVINEEKIIAVKTQL